MLYFSDIVLFNTRITPCDTRIKVNKKRPHIYGWIMLFRYDWVLIEYFFGVEKIKTARYLEVLLFVHLITIICSNSWLKTVFRHENPFIIFKICI